MRSDTRYREARSSLLASLFVVLAVFVIGKESPPHPSPASSEETAVIHRDIYLSYCLVSIVKKCARCNNIDITMRLVITNGSRMFDPS